MKVKIYGKIDEKDIKLIDELIDKAKEKKIGKL